MAYNSNKFQENHSGAIKKKKKKSSENKKYMQSRNWEGNTKIKLQNAEGRKLAKIKQEDDPFKNFYEEHILLNREGEEEKDS